MLVLCLFAVSLVTPAKGQNAPLIEECEPMCVVYPCVETLANQTWKSGSSLAASDPQTYIAGYMTTDYLSGSPGIGDAIALCVTVSFSGTNKAVIQSDNWLMVGITAQGPDTVHGGCNAIDWGYIFSLVLAPGIYSDPFVHAEVWECHEWVNCLPTPWAKCVSSWSAVITGITTNSYVTLIMKWGESTLDYSIGVDGTNYFLYSYAPNETASHYFKIGTVGRAWGPIPWPGTVKWFQFHGAWSNYNIGQLGWHSRLSYPGFIRAGQIWWESAPFAYSTDGPNAYLDNTIVWGGDSYTNVYADYSLLNVHFYPTTSSTLQPDTLLWEPPTGGCPYVYAWDGQRYVKDNNLLPTSEISNGVDVDDYYKLEQLLVPTYQGTCYSTYSLQIREFENEHSYFDRVQLLAVDHESDVNVAVTLDGEILTYQQPYAPISCVDDEGNSQLESISAVDNQYYTSYPGGYLTLDFGDLDVNEGVKLVLRADGPSRKKGLECIYIQVLDATGSWMEIAALRARVMWATEIVDLSDYLPDPNGEPKVRLYFTDTYKLDYVGLDTSEQAEIQIHNAYLVSAIHSEEGLVTLKLLFSDNVYAELVSEQKIKLTFIISTLQDEVRSFIFYAEGYYYTMAY